MIALYRAAAMALTEVRCGAALERLMFARQLALTPLTEIAAVRSACG